MYFTVMKPNSQKSKTRSKEQKPCRKASPDYTNLIDVASGDIRRLNAVQRYSSIPVVAFENTAEHSYWVSLYAVMIHVAIYPKFKDDKITAAIAIRALLHDMTDAIAGDVVRTFKYSTPEFRDAVHKAEESMVKELPSSITSLYDMKSNEGDRRYVDAIVKAADFLSLYQYMRREVMRQNKEIIPFFKRMIKDLDEMRYSRSSVAGFDAIDFYDALLHASLKTIGKWSAL